MSQCFPAHFWIWSGPKSLTVVTLPVDVVFNSNSKIFADSCCNPVGASWFRVFPASDSTTNHLTYYFTGPDRISALGHGYGVSKFNQRDHPRRCSWNASSHQFQFLANRAHFRCDWVGERGIRWTSTWSIAWRCSFQSFVHVCRGIFVCDHILRFSNAI